MRFGAIFVSVCLLLASAVTVSSQFSSSSTGRNFVFAFGRNFNAESGGPHRLTVAVTSVPGADITITNQDGSLLLTFSVPAGGSVLREITPVASYESEMEGRVRPHGLRVTATADVAVFVLNGQTFSADATVVYPVASLGSRYVVFVFTDSSVNQPDCVQVVAAFDNTVVALTLTQPAFVSGTLTAAGAASVTLPRALDAVTLCNPTPGVELSGTTVLADKDVAAFGLVQCTKIPSNTNFCNMLFEQLIRTSSWGTDAVVVSLRTRSQGDVVRVVAKTDNTVLKRNGAVIATLNTGQLHQFDHPSDTSAYLETSAPASFYQYSKSQLVDNVAKGDPFFTHLPSSNAWLSDYLVPLFPRFFSHVSIVVRTTATSAVTVNGNAVSSTWSVVGSSPFSATRFYAGNSLGGLLRIRTTNGMPLSVQVYGFNDANAYGYSAGSGFSSPPDPNGGPTPEESCPDCETVAIVQDRPTSVERSSKGGCLTLRFA